MTFVIPCAFSVRMDNTKGIWPKATSPALSGENLNEQMQPLVSTCFIGMCFAWIFLTFLKENITLQALASLLLKPHLFDSWGFPLLPSLNTKTRATK